MLYQPAAYPMRPSGKCQPGSRALLDTILYLTPGLISSGCYNPRTVAGSTTVSLHAEGRAIDVRPVNFKYKPGPWLYEGPARALTEWCRFLASHPETGVQQILWAGETWRTGKGWRRLSTTANQHYDHAHIELTWDAALYLTAARISAALFPPQPAPSPAPNPEPVPDPPPDDEDTDMPFVLHDSTTNFHYLATPGVCTLRPLTNPLPYISTKDGGQAEFGYRKVSVPQALRSHTQGGWREVPAA